MRRWAKHGASAANLKPGRSSCKNYQLANFFPARAVAVGVLYDVFRMRGLEVEQHLGVWVSYVTSEKVDRRDFEEVLEELEKPHQRWSMDTNIDIK
jgi:hypothetical protein